jgi:uncharacterized protein (DUF427 family)
VEKVAEPVKIIFNSEIIVETNHAYRVLETSHPPVYYLPQADIQMEYLTQTTKTSTCEWKGRAVYYNLAVGAKTIEQAAWSYPNPTAGFEVIKDHLAFYAGPLEACYVGEEQVTPQPGGFYGGWITSNISGPFKGGPGTMGW